MAERGITDPNRKVELGRRDAREERPRSYVGRTAPGMGPEADLKQVGESGPTVDRIEVAEFETIEEQRTWLTEVALAFVQQFIVKMITPHADSLNGIA